MSDRKSTPNFRRRNFATSLSLQSAATEEGDEEDQHPFFPANHFEGVSIRMMQSSFDSPYTGDSGSRELLQEDELATTRIMSLDEPDEEEEALDNFETSNDSRIDLEILSPIKLSMLSTQLLSTSASKSIEPDDRKPTVVGNNVISSSLKGGGTKGSGSDSCGRRVDEGSSAVAGRPRKVVEFANFDDNECTLAKQKRTDSTGGGGEAAVEAKIFAEIRK